MKTLIFTLLILLSLAAFAGEYRGKKYKLLCTDEASQLLDRAINGRGITYISGVAPNKASYSIRLADNKYVDVGKSMCILVDL